MRKLWKRLLAVTTAAAMLLGMGWINFPDKVQAAERSYEGDLVVIHTNDIHGHFNTVEGEQLGISAVV